MDAVIWLFEIVAEILYFLIKGFKDTSKAKRIEKIHSRSEANKFRARSERLEKASEREEGITMRQVWRQIGLSIVLSVVVWCFCVFGLGMGGFTEIMDEYDFLWLLLPVTIIVFAYRYLANQKPREGSGTLSEQTQRGVELLEVGTLPRALPQALKGEFNITLPRARKVARVVIKRRQIQRGVELLEAGTLPRALPQALKGEFNITLPRAREIARTATKKRDTAPPSPRIADDG